KLFEAMAPAGGSFQSVTVRAEKKPPTPWNARFRVKSDRGQASLDVLLTPTAPTPDWDGALSGTTGVLTATMLFRRRGNHGEMTTRWRYRAQEDDLRGQAVALSFLG